MEREGVSCCKRHLTAASPLTGEGTAQGSRALGFGASHLGQAKVADLNVTLRGEENVGALQVAMHDLVRVQVLQPQHELRVPLAQLVL
jgi:hypothetical protein